MNPPILTVMPDYGEVYLWILRDSTPDDPHAGGNIARYEFWPDEEFPSVSKKLQEDFDDWIFQFEAYTKHPRQRWFRWDMFHKRGLTLACRLKKQLGDKAIVRYVKPVEDPNHEQEEVTIIE